MKMVMAVVPKAEASAVIDALVAIGHTATFAEARGGVLRQASQALFIAVEDDDLDKVLNVIRRDCRSRVSLASTEVMTGEPTVTVSETAEIGGAVVFVWDLAGFHRY